MEENKREFLGTICNVYLAALFAALPLYNKGTYFRLGDDKYLLFRNVSFICLGLWLGVCLIWGTVKAAKAVRCTKTARRAGVAAGERRKPGTVDFFMAAYGVSVLLSLLCSLYPRTAWAGYRDWYMGALSQLLFVGIYFFVSRNYTGSAWPVYLGEAALFAVTAIGLLNRLGFDPLKLLAPYGPGEWEYGHMLSTIGNINWLCGYYAVALGFAVTGFLYGKNQGSFFGKSPKTLILYIVCIASLTLLCIQGSAGGVMITAICVGICLLLGLKKQMFFEKGLLLAAGTTLSVGLTAVLIKLRGEEATMPKDSGFHEKIAWDGWWVVGGVLVLGYLVFKRLTPGIKKLFIRISLAALVLMASAAGIFYLAAAHWGDAWGSGRGVLWRLSLEGFCRAGWLQKLVGAGPDCFAEYIYRAFPAMEMIHHNGQWQDAIFANAHNEWLNGLVNLGILGVTAYFGIFAAGIWRYRGMLLGLFSLFLYGALSLVSFQQTVSTPLLFAVLGICESRLRNKTFY